MVPDTMNIAGRHVSLSDPSICLQELAQDFSSANSELMTVGVDCSLCLQTDHLQSHVFRRILIPVGCVDSL